MITSAAHDTTPVALRPPFWDKSAMRFWAGFGVLTLGLTIMALIYKVGAGMVAFEAILVAISICGIAVGAIRHRYAPIPKRNFMDLIRDQLGTDELCYPFFRNCTLEDLRGEQGGWTTADKLMMSRPNLHFVGNGPAYLTDAPNAEADTVVLITRNCGVIIALSFGAVPAFPKVGHASVGATSVLYKGHFGPARFDKALFGTSTPVNQ
jgi:hypothetical protein